MTKSNITRFYCNYCKVTAEVIGPGLPPRWKQFEVIEQENDDSYYTVSTDQDVHICSDHVDLFLDFIHGMDGAHRLKLKLEFESK